MNDYTYQDMMRMQTEARERVLEMQKRSKNAADSFNGTQKAYQQGNQQDSFQDPEELPRVPRKISYPAGLREVVHRNSHPVHNKGPGIDIRRTLKSVFGDLSGDDYEKMLILSLCLLLTEDGADESLVMALMYLLA